MKECPRCGSTLSHYAHGDGEAYGCDTCGWVGVDVEHRSEPVRIESWTDAITRFESKFGSTSSADVPGTLDRVDEPVDVPTDDDASDPEPTIERLPTDDESTTADEVDETATTDEPDADESKTADEPTASTEADEPAVGDDEDGVDDGAESEPQTTDDESVDDENQAEVA